ncbi:hypothetical protein IT411_03850 [Candidatus Peregrinibacteria bacterium]|nr:hypothetical protein [Candidatus Peregrinibacteria bacterium]
MYKSTNQRLSRLFGGTGYLNVETTVEVGSEIIYEAPEMALSSSLRKYVHGHIRFIIPQIVIDRYRQVKKSEVKVLSSPYECGRLLEADQTVNIDGKKKVITMKGVGATSFSLRHIQRIADKNHSRGKMEEAEELRKWVSALQTRRFIGEIKGLFGLREARKEQLISQEYEELDLYMQRVLGIYQLCHLPNSKGEFVDISALKGLNIIPERFDPAIIVRAMDSNVRILDFLNLYVLQKMEALDKLIAEVGGKETDEYFYDTVQQIVRNNVLCMVAGKAIVSAKPIIHARNVSVFGEEIDFETVHDDDFKIPNYPFPARQTWPGVVRILHYVLKKRKKSSFNDEDLNNLVEATVFSTLSETSIRHQDREKYAEAIIECWNRCSGNDALEIIRYQEEEKDMIPVDISAAAV